MEIQIIKNSITKAELQKIADAWGSDFVKGVVDVERGMMAIGGEFHADEEEALVAQGSKREDCWGINMFPEKSGEDWIEFDSLINIKPAQGNRSMSVEDHALQEHIVAVVNQLVEH